MNVTREIIKDLLPLYVAGEASADTARLVESFLRDDADLARLAEALRAGIDRPVPAAPPAAGAERAALDRTRALLARRTWLLALALFFTGLPLSFVFGDDGLKFLLIRDAPAAGSASLVAAFALWIAYAVTARRLRVSGL
jgi:anti-sigma factor RsiW